MRYFIFTIFGIAILGGIWFFGRSQTVVEQEVQTEQEVVEYVQPIETQATATINEHKVKLDVVRTQKEQTRGLSGRKFLEEDAGMLFVYERERIPGFWMPDMNFSIDIIWIDKNKKIVGIEEHVAPETYPEIFRPSSPVLYVLEVNAGWSKDHNITLNDEIILDGVF